ncbi:Na+/H+ antiporter [Microlunatus endophyticus]|uniref:Na+/H+ antiporter n=1 Tax=Microlunatus endophyticus TaxID=1716077 RepID=UPI001665A75E|nr:Na+/H+ antiporter [Microlunatus endophyticus]
MGGTIARVEVALGIATLTAVVIAVTALAAKIRVPAPLVLMVVGIAASFVPQLPQVQLSAEIVLIGLLPPLLYAAAIRSSVIDFRAQASAIAVLSVGLVVITALGIGILVHLLLSVPLAVGVAIGAVVAPPDAVAATSVARRVGLPRRIVTILEGESLFNDATAITCLRVAILAMTADVGFGRIGLAFVSAAGGGVLIGLVVAFLAVRIRAAITSARLDNALSLLLPFAAYLPAEEIQFAGLHVSGVIAVVTAGLLIGHKAPVVQTARSRLSERMNWATIQFLLENAVFLLIGLQARWIISDLADSGVRPSKIIAVCAAVFGGVIVVRLLVVAVSRAVLWRTGLMRDGSWAQSAIIGWAGMRGVVTLATAFVLPQQTPYRSVLVFAAMVVTVGSLLLQGFTLPAFARRAGLHGPDPREDALQAASVLESSSRVALETLEEIRRPSDAEDTIEQLRYRITRRTNEMWEHLGTGSDVETPAEEYRRLRMATLTAERKEVLRIRALGQIDHEVIEDVLYGLDVEESMLTVLEDQTGDVSEAEPLLTRASLEGDCEHLQQAPHVIKPNGPAVCEDCRREGLRWVHLRLCLTCGKVGCCDSSVGKHATRHYQDTGHPVMRSFEQGEKWRWCFVDEELG